MIGTDKWGAGWRDRDGLSCTPYVRQEQQHQQSREKKLAFFQIEHSTSNHEKPINAPQRTHSFEQKNIGPRGLGTLRWTLACFLKGKYMHIHTRWEKLGPKNHLLNRGEDSNARPEEVEHGRDRCQLPCVPVLVVDHDLQRGGGGSSKPAS